MKNLVRIVSYVCILSLLLLSFAACGAGNEAQGSTEATTAAGTTAATTTADNADEVTTEEVNLRFLWWGTDARHQATLDTIDLYAKKYPNIKIEGEYAAFDGYYQKLVTQLAGGTAPDIIQVGTNMVPEFINQGDFFVDFRTISDKIIDLNAFDEKLLETCTYNGKLICLPTGSGAKTTLYNKDLFASKGISEDTVWDWDKILETGTRLHKEDSNFYFMFTGAEYMYEIIQMYVFQKTGEQWVRDDYTVGFTKEDVEEALDYLKKLVDNGVIQPAQERAAFKVDTQNPKWANGEFGVYLTWASNIEGFQKATSTNLGVAKVPVMSGAKNSGISVFPPQYMVVNKKSSNVNEAVRFLNFFYNDKDAALTLGTVRSIPPTENARKLLIENNKINPNVAKAVELGYENPASFPNLISTNSELLAIVSDIVKEVDFGKTAPAQAAEKLVKQYNDKLAELKGQKG